jgi:ABC-type antimicrobial peptide transport system permease subunit
MINKITSVLGGSNSGLTVSGTDETIKQNTDFLGSAWATIMLLPIFTVFSAALCLVAYTTLTVDEQRQEFGFLRAMGAKPRTVTTIMILQNAIILLSSLGFGLSLGTVTTLVILMRQPLVTVLTIAEIAAWLFTTLAAMFVLSLVPALKLARASLLRLMA